MNTSVALAALTAVRTPVLDPPVTHTDGPTVPPDPWISMLNSLEQDSRLLQLNRFASRREMVEAYRSDCHRLFSRFDELEQFITVTICEKTILADKATRRLPSFKAISQIAVNEAYGSLVGCPRTPAEPVPDVAWSRKKLLNALRQNLFKALAVRLAEFQDWLLLLAERGRIGTISWSGCDQCVGVFYQRRIGAELTNRSVRKLIDDYDPTRALGRMMRQQNVLDRESVWQTVTERHEHHLVNARTLPLEDSPHRLPRFARGIVASAPDWVRPQLGIVDGVGIKADIEYADARTATTSERTVLSQRFWDPFLIFGRYVLAGWTDQDPE